MQQNTITPQVINSKKQKEFVKNAIAEIQKKFIDFDDLLIYFFGLSDWFAHTLNERKLEQRISVKLNTRYFYTRTFAIFVINIYKQKCLKKEIISQDIEKLFFE